MIGAARADDELGSAPVVADVRDIAEFEDCEIAVVANDPDGRTLKFGDTAVRMHPTRSPLLRAGTPVVFGIRPEHVAEALRPGAGATLKAEIFRIESLGAETIVFAQLPSVENQ